MTHHWLDEEREACLLGCLTSLLHKDVTERQNCISDGLAQCSHADLTP